MALTEMAIRNAKPREKPYKLADADGLHLVVNKSSRLWRMKYRWEGKEKLLSFGAYPVVGLADARQRKLDAKRTLAAGIDPAVQRLVERDPQALSFERIARQWHDNRKGSLVPTHEQRVMARLERDVFPVIGSRSVNEITAQDVLALIRTVEERGALEISRRIKQCIGRVYRFAIAHGWATVDPTANLQDLLKPRPKVQNMPRLPLAELPTFLTKLDAYQGEEQTKLAIRLTLLTWARTNEIRLATWSEFEGDRWRVPAERMKMGREHIVPLSAQALAVVDRLRAMRTPASEWVFPQIRKPMRPMSQNAMIMALYRMGYASRLTIHGLRGMASTWANEADIYKPDWIEMALAHNEEDAVRGAYNAAEYITQRTAMLRDWGAYVAAQDDEFERLM